MGDCPAPRPMRRTRSIHYRNAAFRSVNDEQLSLTVRQSDDQLLITIREVKRHRVRVAVKSALVMFIFIWLVVYVFEVNQFLIHLLSLLLISFACIQFCTRVVEEQLLVVKQSSDVLYSYKYLFGVRRTQTIPSKEIIINEGIVYNRVIYYMGVLLDKNQSGQEEDKIVPIFCKHLPRLDCLKIVFTYLHKFNQCS